MCNAVSGLVLGLRCNLWAGARQNAVAAVAYCEMSNLRWEQSPRVSFLHFAMKELLIVAPVGPRSYGTPATARFR